MTIMSIVFIINVREILRYCDNPMYDIVTLMFAGTYVPLRTIGLSYSSYFMFMDANTSHSSLLTRCRVVRGVWTLLAKGCENRMIQKSAITSYANYITHIYAC